MHGESTGHEYWRLARSADRLSGIAAAVGTVLTVDTAVLALVNERGFAAASAVAATIAFVDSKIFGASADNKVRLAADFEKHEHQRSFLSDSNRLHPEEHMEA
jgi:hypothetical protein